MEVVEMVYSNQVSRDPDDVQCTGAVQQRLVLKALVLYSSTQVGWQET